MDTNHVFLNMMSKGILGGAIGLMTKGVLTDEVEITVVTKAGIRKKGGGSYYDKDYWKRWRRDLDEDGDEIDFIEVKLRKKHLPKKYQISAELVIPRIHAELITMNIINEKERPEIRVEYIEEVDEKIRIKVEKINENKNPLK